MMILVDLYIVWFQAIREKKNSTVFFNEVQMYSKICETQFQHKFFMMALDEFSKYREVQSNIHYSAYSYFIDYSISTCHSV